MFSEVPFWNSAEYGILYGIGIISRNSAKFFTVQFRGIPCSFDYTEFRIPSNEKKGTVARDLPPPFFFHQSTHLGA